jgi:hypothetical protein
MIIQSCGIQLRLLWNLNKSCDIQLRQLNFFLWQPNPSVFSWDFSGLVKCLLVFKNPHISTDSCVEWILWDFLIKNTLIKLFQQSY